MESLAKILNKKKSYQKLLQTVTLQSLIKKNWSYIFGKCSEDIQFNSINVLDNEKMREGIKNYSNWPTIPQLYVKEEFIGGCDIVKEMNESGELLELLNTKGIEVNPS